MFFADFNIDDNFTEFYITSYNGKGKICTNFSTTNDKNKILLSYYELGKGVVYLDNKEVIGSYLQYDRNLILFKTDKNGGLSGGINIKTDEEINKFMAEQNNQGQFVKITKRNEKLKVVNVDYEAYSRINVDRNIPIKVEAEDGKQGWLMWLNGGD